MAIKLEIRDGKLIAINEVTKMETDLGEIGGVIIRKNSMEEKMRWLKGSLLTEQQTADEKFQTRMKIA